MKHFSTMLILSTALSLSACGQMGSQWIDPDKAFASFDQPDVKGVNDTEEDMAKESLKNGDLQRASDYYQQLLDSKKGTPEQVMRYKMAMADVTRRLGRNEAALAMYEELYRDNPTNIDVMEGRGLALMSNGKTVDAGRQFADVMAKDPKRWRTLNALGILFVTKNMVPEAMQYYAEALNNSPDNPAILNNVGLSYATDKQYPRGIEALQQASRLSKTPMQKKQIDLNLAMVYGVSGDLDTAHDIAAKYLEDAALDNNLGLYAHLAKDDSLAKSYLNMALSQSPTYYERAWDNLDVVNDTSRSNDPDAPATASSALPALDPVDGKAKHKLHSKNVTIVPAIPQAAVEPAIPVMPTGKPAGLVVNPGE
jgi:Flp pilus assembly protein TadD